MNFMTSAKETVPHKKRQKINQSILKYTSAGFELDCCWTLPWTTALFTATRQNIYYATITVAGFYTTNGLI